MVKRDTFQDLALAPPREGDPLWHWLYSHLRGVILNGRLRPGTRMPSTRHAPRTLYGHGETIGYRPLRRAIAEYLGAARGVRCSPDQIVVTSGAQPALDLIVRLLIDPGDEVWMEDPGYPRMISALRASGA